METIAALIKWLVEYSITGGFWHFIACVWVLGVLARFTTLVHIVRTTTRPTTYQSKD